MRRVSDFPVGVNASIFLQSVDTAVGGVAERTSGCSKPVILSTKVLFHSKCRKNTKAEAANPSSPKNGHRVPTEISGKNS